MGDCVRAYVRVCVHVCSSERWPHPSPSGPMSSHTAFIAANHTGRVARHTIFYFFFHLNLPVAPSLNWYFGTEWSWRGYPPWL